MIVLDQSESGSASDYGVGSKSNHWSQWSRDLLMYQYLSLKMIVPFLSAHCLTIRVVLQSLPLTTVKPLDQHRNWL